MAKRNGVRKNDDTLQVQLGIVVRTLRQKLGITQEELAWRANMHRTYLADIERGGRNITLRSVSNLAEALQIPVESLLARARGRNSGASDSDTLRGGVVGEILLVEDNVADADLTVRAFERARFTNPVKVMRDGEEALDYLFGTGRHAKRKSPALPQVVLLDLNLPKIPGLEVLRRIKADARTRVIPVVVLSMSRFDRDIIECARLGAANYIIKPVSFDSFCKVTPKLSLSWALLNRPDREDSLPGGREKA